LCETEAGQGSRMRLKLKLLRLRNQMRSLMSTRSTRNKDEGGIRRRSGQ